MERLRTPPALLDRPTHRCYIFEMNGESYRFQESKKKNNGSSSQPKKTTRTTKPTDTDKAE